MYQGNLTYTSYVDSTQTLSEIFPHESFSANFRIWRWWCHQALLDGGDVTNKWRRWWGAKKNGPGLREFTLPKTNIEPEHRPSQKDRCYVSLREGRHPHFKNVPPGVEESRGKKVRCLPWEDVFKCFESHFVMQVTIPYLMDNTKTGESNCTDFLYTLPETKKCPRKWMVGFRPIFQGLLLWALGRISSMIFSSSGADCQRGLMVGKNYNPPRLAGIVIEPVLELNHTWHVFYCI